MQLNGCLPHRRRKWRAAWHALAGLVVAAVLLSSCERVEGTPPSATPAPTAAAPTPAVESTTTTISAVAVSTSPTITPAPLPAATAEPARPPDPTVSPEPTAAAPPRPVTTPSPTPAPTVTAMPPEEAHEHEIGFDLGDRSFYEATWRDVFETLSPPEQSCIRNELDAGQLSSALQGPLLRFFTLPAPWQVDFFRCLDPETGLFLLIYWLGEGSEGLTANSISCAQASLAEGDVATYVVGTLPDADPEDVKLSRAVFRSLLACNIRPLRDRQVHSGGAEAKIRDLCIYSRFSETLRTLLLGQSPRDLPQSWQEQVFACLDAESVARLLFEVLPTSPGGVRPEQEACVRNMFDDNAIARGIVFDSNPNRVTASQVLVDGLRTCIPELELSGDDAHPVERYVRLWSSDESACLTIEVGETFLDLVLGKPFRPDPEVVHRVQSCFVLPTAASISLAVVSQDLDGLTHEHQSCVQSLLADAEFEVALLPGQSLTSFPAFREFASEYRACIADAFDSSEDSSDELASDVLPLWRFSTDGPIEMAPTLYDSVAYVVSDDHLVYAIDAGSGEGMWTFDAGGEVNAPPVTADGVVYVESDNYLYALDSVTGELLWHLDAGPEARPMPAVRDERVYVSIRVGSVLNTHALDPRSGNVVWIADVPMSLVSRIRPTVVGSRLYVADLGNILHALDSATGAVEWTFAPELAIASPPVVAAGRVFLTAGTSIHALDEVTGKLIWQHDFSWSFWSNGQFLSHDIPPIVDEDTVYFTAGKRIYRLAAATGEVLWSFRMGGSIATSPAIEQGIVYITSTGNQLVAADPSKAHYRPEEIKWGFDLGSETIHSPKVSNGVLYAQSSDGTLKAFDGATGYLLWKSHVGDFPDQPSHTVVDDTVYSATSDGSVFAFATSPIAAPADTQPVPEAREAEPRPESLAAQTYDDLASQDFNTYSMGFNDDGASINANQSGSELTMAANWESPKKLVQWTPDGSRILFSVGPKVYQVQADGSGLRHLVDASTEMRKIAGSDYEEWALHALQISPDGDYLAYSTFEHPDRPARRSLPDAYEYEIGILQIDGGDRQLLTLNYDYDDYPAWSSDGSSVAFVQWDFDSGYGIRTVDLDSPSETVAVSGFVLPRAATRRQTPVWSPDGKHLAFVGVDRIAGLGQAIYTVKADGSDLRLLAKTVSRPAWSPDSTRIAFAQPDGSQLALYTVAADGADLQRITTIELSNTRASYISVGGERDVPGSAGFQASDGWRAPVYESLAPTSLWVKNIQWSPDGSMIMYGCGVLVCVSTAAGDPVGTSPLALTRGMVGAWSPDGTRIAVGRLELPRPAHDHGVALYTMAPDGTNLRLLLRHDSEGDLHPLGVRPTLPPVSTEACATGPVVANASENPGLVNDCRILLSVRDVLSASPPLNWSGDRPIADWEGVEVGGDPLRVLGLSISHRAMSGVIPKELGALTHLEHLDLGSNRLSGPIPAALGNLKKLRTLTLLANYLSGRIPPHLGNLQQLQRLSLSRNYLQGLIPQELGHLKHVESLDLSNALLSGQIPLEFSNLEALRYLSLGANRLTGQIPLGFGNLNHLTVLSLSHNHLSGEIPRELGHLTGLDVLELHGNQLSGKLPSELGHLTNLRVLFLNHNRFTGHIPLEFGGLRSLWHLHLNDNSLSGPIPAELGHLTSVTELLLQSNNLTGAIPPEIGNLIKLRSLNAADNQLGGAIPAELGWLVELTDLDLAGNQLSGSIPSEIGHLASLHRLDLYNNNLSGSIPAEIGLLTKAWGLHLHNNELTGPIPGELVNLSLLWRLDLHGNLLTGAIPSSVGELFELRYLNLAENQLNGKIPAVLGQLRRLDTLDLSGNQLDGPILPALGSIPLLDELDLSDNQLAGSIPPELAWNPSLDTLNLANNQLTGSIPSDLGYVSYLRVLKLDGNQLTGEIPPEFERLFRLEELGLVGNRISGCLKTNLRFARIEGLEDLGLDYCSPQADLDVQVGSAGALEAPAPADRESSSTGAAATPSKLQPSTTQPPPGSDRAVFVAF